MKHSPLLETQRRLTATPLSLIPILDNTWEMPANYGLPGNGEAPWRVEYDAITQNVGMIDRSYRAVLQLRGRDRLTFLHAMVSNDVQSLQVGQGCRAALLKTTAHILADMRIHVHENVVLLECDPRCATTLAQALEKYLIMEKVAITDVSDDWAIISVQGPAAQAALTSALQLFAPDVPTLLSSTPIIAHGSAEGYAIAQADTGQTGYDLWLPASAAPDLWTELMGAGVVPVGEEASETLRIESGIAAWGSELNESVLLPEAELPDTISYTKGCYVGQEIIARLHARGHTNRMLRGVLLDAGDAAPHPGDTLHAPEDAEQPDKEIGRITSAAISLKHDNRPLALAYVRKEFTDEGARVTIRQKNTPNSPLSMHAIIKTIPIT